MEKLWIFILFFLLFFNFDLISEKKKIDFGPGPMKPFGKKITDASNLKPGNPIQILWKGEWWLGSVVKVHEDNKVKVHYYGWEFKWDQVVDIKNILLIKQSPGAIKPTGDNIKSDTKLKPGDPVQVEWKGSWYLGTIMELEKDGKVKIHYFGWSHSYDELVPIERLKTVPLKKK